ncbi:hypothetical protein PJP13_29775, partial [Mycobacterium kansasii]
GFQGFTGREAQKDDVRSPQLFWSSANLDFIGLWSETLWSDNSGLLQRPFKITPWTVECII